MKKQLSALLALSMVTGALNFNAFAQEEEKLVSVMYDMTSDYNTDMIYTSIGPTVNGSYRNGKAAYAGFFARKAFTELPYWEEGTSWVDNEINVMNFEGTRFTFYVPDSLINADGQNCTWRNVTDKNTSVFKKFDVTDGKYESIEIMSNTDRNERQLPMDVYIELNYEDGTELVQYETQYVTNKQPEGIPVLKSYSANNEAENDYVSKNLWNIAKNTVELDNTRVLESFGIMYDGYFINIAEDGSYTTANKVGLAIDNTTKLPYKDEAGNFIKYADIPAEEKANYIEVTSSRGISMSNVNVYAITLMQTEEEFEAAKITSIPVDMSGMYNIARIYTDSPSYTNGAAGYAGTIYRPSFFDLPYWDEGTDWDKSLTNTMTLEGVKFQLYVPECHDNNNKDNAVYANQEANVVYKNIDVKDGKYQSINFIANSNRAGTVSQTRGQKLAVKLNYSDNTSEVVESEYNLNFLPNGYYTPSGLKPYMAHPNMFTDSTKLKYGHIGHHSIKVNRSKTLVSYDILNQQYDYERDADGNIIKNADGSCTVFDTTNLGCKVTKDATGKVTWEYTKDADGNYIPYDASVHTGYTKIADRGNFYHTAAIYAMSLVQTQGEYSKAQAQAVIDAIDAIPEYPTAADKNVIDAAQAMYDEYIKAGYPAELITNYDVLKEAIDSALKFVSIPVDMSDMYNTARIYTDSPSYTNGAAGYAGTIYRPSFFDLPYWDEGTDWDKSLTNTMTFDGIKFQFYVPECHDNSNADYAIYGNQETNIMFKNIDVADRKYQTIEFIANANRNTTNASLQQRANGLAVKLNYSDGTSEIVESEYKLNFIVNPYQTPTGLRPYMANPDMFTNSTKLRYANIGHHTIKVDQSKVLESYDIVNQRYDFERDADGKIVKNADGSYTMFDTTNLGCKVTKDTATGKITWEYTKDADGNYIPYDDSVHTGYAKIATRGAYYYTVAVYAMTLVQSLTEYSTNAAVAANEAIAAIPENITYADKAVVVEAKKLVDDLIAVGVDTKYITDYDKYLAAVEKIDGYVADVVEPDLFVNSGRIYESDPAVNSANGYVAFMSGNAINSKEFKSQDIWKAPWTEVMTDNVLEHNGYNYKLRVVDGQNDGRGVKYYSILKGTGTAAYKSIDIVDGNYAAINILAHRDYSYSYRNYDMTFGAVLVYEDGEEYVESAPVQVSNTYSDDSIKVYKNESGEPGTTAFYLHHYEIMTDETRTLKEIKYLGTKATATYNAETEAYDINAAGSTNEDHRITTFAMSLVTTKANLTEKYAPYVEAIKVALATLENAPYSYNSMKAIAENIEVLAGVGIDANEIEGIDAYYELLPYFAEVTNVKTYNDTDNAYIELTLDRAIPEDINTSYTVLKDTVETDVEVNAENIMTGDKITGIKLSFAHDMDFDVVNAVKIVIGNGISYNQRVTVLRPLSFDDVVISDDDNFEDLKNFYETQSDNFVVRGTLNKNYDDAEGKMVLAVYDDNRRLVAMTGEIEAGDVEEVITVGDVEMNENWTLKAFIWSSINEMKPGQDVIVLNKTYGYDNVVDNSKDLKIAYFGDSQTAGNNVTNPLTTLLSLPREISGASVEAKNFGVGGTSMFLGMYRFDDVIETNPDILFVEFYPNDANGLKTDSTREAKTAELISWHENIIKRARANSHVPVIIYWNPMSKSEVEITNANGEKVKVPHNSLAVDALADLLEEYDIPMMDFDVYTRAQQADGNAEYDWSKIVAADGTHFTAAGGQLCAEWMYSLLTEEADTYIRETALNVPTVSEITYENPKMIPSIYGMYDSNWALTRADSANEGYWDAVEVDAYPEGYMATKEVGAEMTFTFKGTELNMYTLVGKNGGKATYVIDGKKTGTIDLYSTYSMYKCQKAIITGLEDTEHTVTITTVAPNANATDAAFGIGYFLVDRD